MSVHSKRIMARVLEQIKYGATSLCPAYTVGIMDLIKNTKLDRKAAYKYAKMAVDELADVRWNFEDLEKQIYIPRHLLNTSLPAAQASRVEGGLITIVLNPALAPYFVNLADSYTSFNLDDYMGLRSWYAMRLYEILASWHDTGVWYVSIEQYRLIMDCGPELDKLGKPKKTKTGEVKMKLANTGDLIIKTVTHAQTELADTAYNFDFEPISEEKAGPGRRKYTHFKFTLRRPLHQRIPAEWLKDATHVRLIEGLRKFEISESNIIKYWDVLLPTGLRKLLREWQLKENGNERINSQVSYCNAALVRAGKQLLELRRQHTLDSAHGLSELFPSGVSPAWLQDE